MTVLRDLLSALLAPLHRLDLAISLWRDRGLSYTWRGAWRAAARHF